MRCWSRDDVARCSVGCDPAALDALDPSWDDLVADHYLRDGGNYRKRRHSCFGQVDDPSNRSRTAPTGNRRTTTPCMAACVAGSSRSRRQVVDQPVWRAAAGRARRASSRALKPARLVRRGAPVPHRHHRWHRPADAGRRASRRRRLRRRVPGRPRRHQGRRNARVRGGRARRPALHLERALVAAAAGRRARHPRVDADPAAADRRASRHAGADLSRGRLPGRQTADAGAVEIGGARCAVATCNEAECRPRYNRGSATQVADA